MKYSASVKKFRALDGNRISSSRSQDPATRPYTPLNKLFHGPNVFSCQINSDLCKSQVVLMCAQNYFPEQFSEAEEYALHCYKFFKNPSTKWPSNASLFVPDGLCVTSSIFHNYSPQITQSYHDLTTQMYITTTVFSEMWLRYLSTSNEEKDSYVIAFECVYVLFSCP